MAMPLGMRSFSATSCCAVTRATASHAAASAAPVASNRFIVAPCPMSAGRAPGTTSGTLVFTCFRFDVRAPYTNGCMESRICHDKKMVRAAPADPRRDGPARRGADDYDRHDPAVGQGQPALLRTD